MEIGYPYGPTFRWRGLSASIAAENVTHYGYPKANWGKVKAYYNTVIYL